MKLLLGLFTLSLFAQTGPSLTATVSGSPRYWPTNSPPFTINVALSGSSTLNIAAIEFTIAVPPNSTVNAVAGAASTAAMKTITCGTPAATITCIIFGINSTTISDGVIATLNISLPANSTPGSFSAAETNLSSANVSGVAVTINSGTALSFNILNPCDINGDGLVNAADVSLTVGQAIGASACSTADLVGNGMCVGVNGLLDVLRVINAVLGNACKTGP